jgi:sulfite reductase alpha subunit-like flavoprotein
MSRLFPRFPWPSDLSLSPPLSFCVQTKTTILAGSYQIPRLKLPFYPHPVASLLRRVPNLTTSTPNSNLFSTRHHTPSNPSNRKTKQTDKPKKKRKKKFKNNCDLINCLSIKFTSVIEFSTCPPSDSQAWSSLSLMKLFFFSLCSSPWFSRTPGIYVCVHVYGCV